MDASSSLACPVPVPTTTSSPTRKDTSDTIGSAASDESSSGANSATAASSDKNDVQQQQQVNASGDNAASSKGNSSAIESDGATFTRQDPAALLAEADRLIGEEQLLEAARLIARVQEQQQGGGGGASLLTEKHRVALALARDCERAIEDLVGDPHDDLEWKKQGECHGEHEYEIFYKIDANGRLTCRIESPIDASLLVPLLAVFNEIDLYPLWIPTYTKPIKLGVSDARTIQKLGKVNRILRILGVVPWPFYPREVVMQVTACDDIDQAGYLAIRMHEPSEGGGQHVPPPDRGVERIDFDGAILIRACPQDDRVKESGGGGGGDQKEGDVSEKGNKKILVSFKMFVDPHMRGVPSSVLNFVTRTVIGRIWLMLLSVAEGVRDGGSGEGGNNNNKKKTTKKSKDGSCGQRHRERIEEQAQYYAWVEERIQVLFDKAEGQRG